MRRRPAFTLTKPTPRSTTSWIRSVISSPAKSTNRDALPHWPNGAPSRPNGRLGMGVLRHTQTTAFTMTKPGQRLGSPRGGPRPECANLRFGTTSPLTLRLWGRGTRWCVCRIPHYRRLALGPAVPYRVLPLAGGNAAGPVAERAAACRFDWPSSKRMRRQQGSKVQPTTPPTVAPQSSRQRGLGHDLDRHERRDARRVAKKRLEIVDVSSCREMLN